jgi:hypothetical protein
MGAIGKLKRQKKGKKTFSYTREEIAEQLRRNESIVREIDSVLTSKDSNGFSLVKDLESSSVPVRVVTSVVSSDSMLRDAVNDDRKISDGQILSPIEAKVVPMLGMADTMLLREAVGLGYQGAVCFTRGFTVAIVVEPGRYARIEISSAVSKFWEKLLIRFHEVGVTNDVRIVGKDNDKGPYTTLLKALTQNRNDSDLHDLARALFDFPRGRVRLKRKFLIQAFLSGDEVKLGAIGK